jgi:hypothetical protein
VRGAYQPRRQTEPKICVTARFAREAVVVGERTRPQAAAPPSASGGKAPLSEKNPRRASASPGDGLSLDLGKRTIECLLWVDSGPYPTSLNIGYLNAKYTNFRFTGSAIVDPFNYSGNRMASSPEWQGGVSIDLDQPINDKLNLVGSVLASYTGSFYFSPADISTTRQPGYWNVNTRIGIRSADHKYGIFLDVENLFNQYYWVFGANYENPNSTFRADNVPGTPRTIKGTLELKF